MLITSHLQAVILYTNYNKHLGNQDDEKTRYFTQHKQETTSKHHQGQSNTANHNLFTTTNPETRINKSSTFNPSIIMLPLLKLESIKSQLNWPLLLLTGLLLISIPKGLLIKPTAASLATNSGGVAPTIDYSHNMRILKLPKSTQVGELIYRLRGSDGDPSGQLMFGVHGIEARTLIDIVPVIGSWNEADVYLKSPLLEPVYNLTIYVSDGNKTTQVESTLLVVDDSDYLLQQQQQHQLIQPQPQPQPPPAPPPPSADADQNLLLLSNNDLQQHNESTTNFSFSSSAAASFNSQRQWITIYSPFVRPQRTVFNVPENTKPGETIGLISVLESRSSELPVRFELRGPGADKFQIRYVFGPRGQSKGELLLGNQPVDYEQQNLFSLKVLALNAWTNARFDTRNVATMDIVITVGDVQDTPPKFVNLPHSLRLSNQMQPGDFVSKLEAQDGDLADQRPIKFALDASSPLAGYFELNPTSGELRLAQGRPIGELIMSSLLTNNPNPNQPQPQLQLQQPMVLTIFASEQPDSSSYEHLWPPMLARAELPIIIVDQINEPPQFVGGWQTGAEATRVLHGYIIEPRTKQHHHQITDLGDHQPSLGAADLVVQWYTNHSALISGGGNTGHDYDSSLLASPSSTSTGSLLLPVASERQLIRQTGGRPLVVDLGQGSNGSFELYLEGPDAHLFQVEPSGYAINRQSIFTLKIAPEWQHQFDRESPVDSNNNNNNNNQQQQQLQNQALVPTASKSAHFQVDLVAKDFGSSQRLSSRIKCSIELIDANDNAPQFELDLYTFVVNENAQLGQIIGNIRARDLDQSGTQRVRYLGLSGRDSQLFHLDQTTGLITLEGGQLDREKVAHYQLVAEARDPFGLSNYTRILINVLDANDNAPIFGQSHYDAILQSDGSFQQPLVVRAEDLDEPNTANSQVSYEIIAGNLNEQFAIDSVSGTIYLTGGGGSISPSGGLINSGGGGGGTRRPPAQIPSILSEPIVPFDPNQRHREPQQLAGKILPSSSSPPAGGSGGGDIPRGRPPNRVEIEEEETSGTGGGLAIGRSGDRGGRLMAAPPASNDRVPATSARHQQQAAPSDFDPLRVASLTTLIVRAHDFGIPLRSSTCKVNIYNLALVSRSISVILNGTSEQLELRREAIERALGSLMGSRASVESFDALSDSSSLSVARIKLTSLAHSLVDLTDLSGLINALGGGGSDHRSPSANWVDGEAHKRGEQQQQQPQSFATPIQHHKVTHYIAAGDRIYPAGVLNLTAPPPSGGGGGLGGSSPTTFYTDIDSIALLDSGGLERKLLIYIIIVGVCILALLVIWMIYSCLREDQQQQQHQQQHTKAEKSPAQSTGTNPNATAEASRRPETTQVKTSPSAASSAIGNNLAKSLANGQQQQHNHHRLLPVANNSFGTTNQMAGLARPQHHLSVSTMASKLDHYSMYNGQVWFEPSLRNPSLAGCVGDGGGGGSYRERRASSAPSATSHQQLHLRAADLELRAPLAHYPHSARPAAGQFFPNIAGFMENVGSIGRQHHQQARVAPGAAVGSDSPLASSLTTAHSSHKPSAGHKRRGRLGRGYSRKVAPMELGGGGGVANEAFEGDTGAHPRRRSGARDNSASAGSCSPTASGSSSTTASCQSRDQTAAVYLDSDQELLGFDSSGAPVIATHTAPRLRDVPGGGGSNLSGRHHRRPSGPAAVVATTSLISTAGGHMGASKQQDGGGAAAGVACGPQPEGASGESEAAPFGASGNEQQAPSCATNDRSEQQQAINSETETTSGAKSSSSVAQQLIDKQQPKQTGGRQQQQPLPVVTTTANNPIKSQASARDESRRSSQNDEAGDGSKKSRPAGLMGELNERLASREQQQKEQQDLGATISRTNGRNIGAGTAPTTATIKHQGSGGSIGAGASPRAKLTLRRQSGTTGGDHDETSTPAAAPAATLMRQNDAKSAAMVGAAASALEESRAKQTRQNEQRQRSESRDSSASTCCDSVSSSSCGTQVAAGTGGQRPLGNMKNAELLERQSVFALTYSGITTNKPPN